MKEFKGMLKKLGVTYKEFAEKIDLSYESFLTMTSGKAELPRWAKAFMLGYKYGQKSNKDETL